MKDKKDLTTLHEQRIIIKCILNGNTLKQIAQELKCAKSTASYKARKLFEEYSASDRYEFVVNIFTKIIAKYKTELLKLQMQIEQYKKHSIN